jgi:hypothetical protein
LCLALCDPTDLLIDMVTQRNDRFRLRHFILGMISLKSQLDASVAIRGRPEKLRLVYDEEPLLPIGYSMRLHL